MQALHHFDELFRSASDDELKAIDELVSRRSELTIYSGLSRQFPQAKGSVLASIWIPGKSLQHRSLHALSALARLEVAAMLAGHLQRRAAIPNQLGPRPAERDIYLEFLRDAVMFHAFSVAAEVERPAMRSINPAEMLTYERRMMQAEKIAVLFYELAGSTLSRREVVELRNIQRGLAQIAKPLREALSNGARSTNRNGS